MFLGTNKMSPRRLMRGVLFSLVLAFPLLGAGECSDITGSDSGSSSSSTNYDGTYDLVSVGGRSISPNGFDITFVNASNRLTLTKGVWTVSGRGTKLRTEMYTSSTISGRTTSEARFNPEVHTANITVSGGTATGRLDSGSSVTATISGGTLLTDSYNNKLRFQKR